MATTEEHSLASCVWSLFPDGSLIIPTPFPQDRNIVSSGTYSLASLAISGTVEGCRIKPLRELFASLSGTVKGCRIKPLLGLNLQGKSDVSLAWLWWVRNACVWFMSTHMWLRTTWYCKLMHGCMVYTEQKKKKLCRYNSSFTGHQPGNNQIALSVHHFGGY